MTRTFTLISSAIWYQKTRTKHDSIFWSKNVWNLIWLRVIRKMKDLIKNIWIDYEKIEKIKEIDSERRSYYLKDLIDDYEDVNGNKLFRVLKNRFNYYDRSTQTQNPKKVGQAHKKPNINLFFFFLFSFFTLLVVNSKKRTLALALIHLNWSISRTMCHRLFCIKSTLKIIKSKW